MSGNVFDLEGSNKEPQSEENQKPQKKLLSTRNKKLLVVGMSSLALAAVIFWPSNEERGGPGSGGSGGFDTFENRITTKKESGIDIGGIFSSRKSETTVTESDSASPAESMAPPSARAPDMMPMPMPVTPPYPTERYQPQPRAGLLTGADYDDLLNPELYSSYASNFLQNFPGSQLPFVDSREKINITVKDQRGRPIPFARVSIPRNQANPLSLVTNAEGKVVVFPRFDRISSGASIVVQSGGQRVSTRLGNGNEVSVRMKASAKAVDAVDIVIALDTTGSMGDEIDYLESELSEIMSRMRQEAGQVDLRIGLVVYRDIGDEYVVRKYNFSRDIGAMQSTLAQQSAGGGGDSPEAVDRAMQSVEEFQFRQNASKIVLLVADAPPHSENIDRTLQSTERLRRQGVQVVPVAASGVEDMAEYTMRTMALMTQGRYIFITDDSGIGNPHAEPKVDCYVVTSLNNVIARVLSGIIKGQRIEPGQGEIIRSVGSYDRGRCSIERQDYPQLTSRPLPIWES